MKRVLAAGSRVAVVAPSGTFDAARRDEGLEILRGRGLELARYDGALQADRYLAADDDTRLDRLIKAWTDPDVDALWAIRGGFGVTRLLDRIPWDRLRDVPVLGFSDLTPLLDAWSRRGGLALHAPVLHNLAGIDDPWQDHLFDLLRGHDPLPLPGRTWVDGTAVGPLCGGNLAMIAATCGTRWQLDARGRILVLEDVGEPAYRLDRMLVQLRQAGVFDEVAGIALGTFSGGPSPSEDVDAALQDATTSLGVPVLADLPIGHTDQHAAFPIGARARIARGQLTFDGIGRS